MNPSVAPHPALTAPDLPDLPSYVRAVLDAYKVTPGTTGHVRPADRRLARDLYRRAVPLQTVLDAFLLATVRRYARALPGSLPTTVRSMTYFTPVVDEILSAPLVDSYRSYLAAWLHRYLPVLGIIR